MVVFFKAIHGGKDTCINNGGICLMSVVGKVLYK